MLSLHRSRGYGWKTQLEDANALQAGRERRPSAHWTFVRDALGSCEVRQGQMGRRRVISAVLRRSCSSSRRYLALHPSKRCSGLLLPDGSCQRTRETNTQEMKEKLSPKPQVLSTAPQRTQTTLSKSVLRTAGGTCEGGALF